MSSRDRILTALKQNQPALHPLPDINIEGNQADVLQRFAETLTMIGGSVQFAEDEQEAMRLIRQLYPEAKRVIASSTAYNDIAEVGMAYPDPHLLEDVDVFIVEAQFGVAENGACWITESQLQQRVLPFIAQTLVIVVRKENIVGTMRDAYKIIGNDNYGFGAFIAGPSKTADIEQSLVLGAHGPKSMLGIII